jgi:hypothetical protein
MQTIEAAPPITKMIQFGGNLSHAQYKEIIADINARI